MFFLIPLSPLFRFQGHVRFSWSTSVTLMDKGCCPVEWECEDEGAGAGQPSLAAMMTGGGGKKLRNRHSYFRARKLHRVADGW